MQQSDIQLKAKVIQSNNFLNIKADKHIPRGWEACYVGANEQYVRLCWDDGDLALFDNLQATHSLLRITNAVDYRDEQEIEVRLTQSQELIGIIDVRYSYAFQFFELALSKEIARRAIMEGIELSCAGRLQQLWLFNDQNKGIDQHYFIPHLLLIKEEVSDKVEAAISSLLSFKSIQPFGWIEGVVLDGIHSFMDGKYKEQAKLALDKHLSVYISPEGKLVYEDLHGYIADGSFTTIEATLPVAIIAKHSPKHPLIDAAISFFKESGLHSELIIDQDMVSAEGCYTVAYPLAVIATTKHNRELAKLAISQILYRKHYLTSGEDVYLRYMLHSQLHTFKNWSRAYGWYYLGMVKTYCTLKDSEFSQLPELNEIQTEIIRLSELVIKYKRSHGLWNVFLNLPETNVETSGSAAIAAAMAIAAKQNIISEDYVQEAWTCYQALKEHMTCDGLLSGVSQHNAGGIKLQLSSYRVLSQMGLGLWGQLHSALNK